MGNDLVKYLKRKNFKQRLKNLEKRFKGKKIVIYGTGILFNTIREEYDLSNLNIIAVSDRKFETENQGSYAGFKSVAPKEIKELKPDCVLVSTLNVVNVLEYLRYQLLAKEDIRITSIVKKSFWEVIKEIWC